MYAKYSYISQLGFFTGSAPCPTPNPADADKIPFINSEKNYSGCQQSAHKYYGLVGLGAGLGLALRSVYFIWFVLLLWAIMWRHLFVRAENSGIQRLISLNNAIFRP